MRWPWQRAEQPVADAPARVPPAGWAFLPPLQRQLADAAPATLRPGFVSSLPTRSMPNSLGTMSHLVDPGAPAGTFGVDDAALGTPVQRAVAGELSLRPRQPPGGVRTVTPTAPADAPQPVADGATVQRVPDVAESASSDDPAAFDGSPPTESAAIADASSEPSVTHDSGSPPLSVHEQETIEPAGPATPEPTAGLVGDAAGVSVSRLLDDAARPASPGRLVQRAPTEASPAPVQRRVGLGAPLAPPTRPGHPAEAVSAPVPQMPVPQVSRTTVSRTTVSRSADVPADVPEALTAVAGDLPTVETPVPPSAIEPARSDGEEEPRGDAAHDEPPEKVTVPILMHSRVVEPPATLGSVDGGTNPMGPVVAITRPTLQRAQTGVAALPDRVDGATPDELEVTPPDTGETPSEPAADVVAMDAVATGATTSTVAAPAGAPTQFPAIAGPPSPPLPLRSVPIVAARSIEPAIGRRPLGPEPSMAQAARVVAARVIAPGAPAHATPGSSAHATPGSSGPAESAGHAPSPRSVAPVHTTGIAASLSAHADAARADEASGLQRVPESPLGTSVSRSITASPIPAAGAHAAARPVPGAPVVQRAFGMPSLPSAPRLPQAPRLPSVADLPAMPGPPSVSDLPSAPGLPSADELRERAADAIPDLAGQVPGAADAVRTAASDAMTQAGRALSAPGGAGASASSGPENVEQLVRKLYGPLVRRIKAELLLDRERRGIRIDGI